MTRPTAGTVSIRGRCLPFLLAAMVAASAASASVPDTLGGMTFEVPDGWTPTGAPPNKSYTKAWTDHGRTGRATLIVAALSAKTLSDQEVAALAASVPELAARPPLATGAGLTADGYRIRWQERCCGTRNGVSLGATTVALDNGPAAAVLMLITANLVGDGARAAQDEFGALVRSLRPTPDDRGFRLEPPPGSGDLDGAYTHLETGLMPNVFGGLNFLVANRILLFDPAGRFSAALPAEPGGIAEHCAKTPSDCGTYRLLPSPDHPAQIELRRPERRFGAFTLRTEPFARSESGLTLAGAPWRRLTPFPPRTTLAGTWHNEFAQSGSTAFASSSVSSEHALTLTSDGRYTLTGFTGFSGTNQGPRGQTGVTVGGPQRPQSGRYAIDGYRITFTADDGTAHASSLFMPDPSDAVLVLDGSNYLREKSR